MNTILNDNEINISGINLNEDNEEIEHEERKNDIHLLDVIACTGVNDNDELDDNIVDDISLEEGKFTPKGVQPDLDDTMKYVKKRLPFGSKDSVESDTSRRILRERSRSNDIRRDSSCSKSLSRSRKKKTLSRTSYYEKYERSRCENRGYNHEPDRFRSEQIIILNIPLKFDRDMEFVKHISDLFKDLKILNFNHDSFRPGFMIGRLIDNPNKIDKFYRNFVCTTSKFREYEFKISKSVISRTTPMMKFTYRVIKYSGDIISLD